MYSGLVAMPEVHSVLGSFLIAISCLSSLGPCVSGPVATVWCRYGEILNSKCPEGGNRCDAIIPWGAT